MSTSIEKQCELFKKNRAALKAYCKWSSEQFYPICASIFIDERKSADPERLRQCRRVLRKETGIFSTFRSGSELVMISMLAVENLPELQMRRAREVYALLRELFIGSEYLAVAAMHITKMVEPDRYKAISTRAKRLYEKMKQDHPFQIDASDAVVAIMMAMSQLTDVQLLHEAENCEVLLRKELGRGTAVRTLARVLTLIEATSELKCHRVISLYRLLKKKGYCYGTGYELATLGVLAMLPADIETIAYETILAYKCLSGQKCYGVFGLSKTQRLMHAGMIVTSSNMRYKENSKMMNNMAITCAIALVAAQRAAMCVAVAAAGTAAASSLRHK